ncbi:caspase family protein [Dyadobacter sp. CY261]|uniref:caspase family protein n=1 Tax=Dyadobacter sp. CY261 TaxID=2907203 RepID=UPI001F211C37|nr:caspase family protein [Dyadobacter sp. CY261]MCF0070795.1 caspase family protein [Dyadobacter sp. CY261]
MLSIGIDKDGLVYPSSDAREIYKIFKTQTGSFYGSVEGVLLTCRKNTAGSFIAGTIKSLTRRNIRSNDVFVLFLSSHGTISHGDFGFHGSDEFKGDRSFFRFREDILQELNRLHCKRIVMLDACHSGAAGVKSGDKSLIESVINSAPPQIVVLSSSSESEESYEHGKWKHGAFTFAVLQGLHGKAEQNMKGSPGYGVISVEELAEYVRYTVPKLVEKEYGSKKQTPRLVNEVLEDFPIFDYINVTIQESGIPLEICNEQEFENARLRPKVVVIAHQEDKKGIDYEMSQLARKQVESQHKDMFDYMPLEQANSLFGKGKISDLWEDRPVVPASLEAEYLLVLKKGINDYRQELFEGHSYWIVEQTWECRLISATNGGLLDHYTLKVSGADADKESAEQYSIRNAISKIKNLSINN